ncbi:MAG: hypothetical protein ACYDGR_07250 [Candidatus Dormibacteria bacterium]
MRVHSPRALVVEDDEKQRAALVTDLKALGFEVWGRTTHEQAMTALDAEEIVDPSIAILDLDMSKAPAGEPKGSASVVLERLWDRFPACTVYVYSSALDRADVLAKLMLRHPGLHAIDKGRVSPEALRQIIGKTLAVKAGDLEFNAGKVYKVDDPLGRAHTHQIAVDLLLHYHRGRPLQVPHRESKTRAVRRFRQWLDLVESNMTVVPMAAPWEYQLVPRHPAPKA